MVVLLDAALSLKRFCDRYGKVILFAYTIVMVLLISITPAYADDIWDKAKEIMEDVYKQIVLISTVAAIVTSATALLLINFSRNDKTVGESRSWLKRIIMTWAILNGLGFIMAYITPLFAGGRWGDVPDIGADGQ